MISRLSLNTHDYRLTNLEKEVVNKANRRVLPLHGGLIPPIGDWQTPGMTASAIIISRMRLIYQALSEPFCVACLFWFRLWSHFCHICHKSTEVCFKFAFPIQNSFLFILTTGGEHIKLDAVLQSDIWVVSTKEGHHYAF